MNRPQQVGENLYAAFAAQDIDGIMKTISPDSHWVYHGTQVIPVSVFEGEDGVRQFFSNILDRTEVLAFEVDQYMVDGPMVVVRGREHQRVKRSGRELRQEWVQIYTVIDGKITRMEEFARTIQD